MSEKLKKFILEKEREILKESGHELTVDIADKSYPDTYYSSYEYNLYEEMDSVHKTQYGEGSGGELKPKEGEKYSPAKMASIRSSSAMTFNLLGNSTIVLKNNSALGHTGGKYSVAYEKQIPTIVSGKAQNPANLDAFLVSEDGSELIFCEMKMMEWFDKNKSELKEAYMEESNYPHRSLYPQFMKAAEVINAFVQHKTFEHYDVWQMFKHTLAVHNYVADHAWDNIKKVTLVNVVFEPNVESIYEGVREEYSNQVESEHEGFNHFSFALSEAGLIDKEGKDFSVKYLTAKQFYECFDISEEKQKYLRRYTF